MAAEKAALKKTTVKKTTAKSAGKAGKAGKVNKVGKANKAAGKYRLVIVESPAKARTIGKYLGRGYHVEASNGHVRDLPKSQMGVDVQSDFEPKYITIRGRGDVLSRIRKEAKGAEKILLATDPDREGEAISWHLSAILNIKPDDECRVTFQEITKKAVKNAIASPRAIDMALVDAQQARRVLDRLVGYNISPLLWAKVRKGLSAGRVQSVATRIIVDREDEINAFTPEEYWDVFASAHAGHQKLRLRLDTIDEKKAQIKNAEQAKEAEAAIKSGVYTIASVKRGERRKSPPAPFTTSSMQQEASRHLRFSTAKTMQIAQTLYEGVELKGEGATGLISYMRTDSVRVSDEALADARGAILAQFGEAYLPEKPNVYKGRKNAQDAHEAIRPTAANRPPDSVKDSLSKDQYNLYKLIYRRFLASQMNPAIYETLTCDIAGGRVSLRYHAERKAFAGFTACYEEAFDEEQVSSDVRKMPELAEGMPITLTDVLSEQHFTQPPPRFTEASLVHALEEKGIGRPSTYAPTISTIISRGYVVRDKRRLVPTELGRMITNMMCEYFKDIVDEKFTSEMESQLDRVEEEQTPWKEVIREFYGGFKEVLKSAEANIEKVPIKDEVSDVPCENCGAMMVYKHGRFGKFLACPNFPKCRNAKPVFTYIETPCPLCGKRLVEKISKKGGKFYSCEGYPECDFIAFDYPVSARCESCGSPMVRKENRKGQVWNVCMNEKCRRRDAVENNESAEGDEGVEGIEGVDEEMNADVYEGEV